MIKDHVRWIVGSVRPTFTPDGKPIPEDWIIYNAPRPLRGALTWINDPISGVFYAASPADDFVSYNFNISQDAHMLKWSTDKDVKKFVDTVLVAELPMDAGLDFEQHREYFQDKFWLYYNYGEI